MMGGSETVSGDKDGVHATAIHVPIGWQRRMEGGQVIYVRWVGSVSRRRLITPAFIGTCGCDFNVSAYECLRVFHLFWRNRDAGFAPHLSLVSGLARV